MNKMTIAEKEKQELYEKREQITMNMLSQLQKGSAKAMKEFFELYSDDIYNFPIRLYGLTIDEAGDFYLYAYEHLKDGRRLNSFKGKSKFTTWFFSVLRNLTIDFLRSRKKKVKAGTFVRIDSNGRVIDTQDEVADIENYSPLEDELFDRFSELLKTLKIEQRILFKLAYIYYFDLTEEEINHIKKQKKITMAKIRAELIRLKEVATEKSNEVRVFEDKLTANFQNIMMLENRIDSFFKQNPSIERDNDNWAEDYENTQIPAQIIEMIQKLSKKKKRHSNLLSHQKKSLLTIRIPYKELTSLLDTNEGVMSVQLIRIIEKLNQGLSNA